MEKKEKLSNLPKHIAIIPDGNRRWAKMRGLKPWEGYRYGTETFEKIYKKIVTIGIPYTTFWIASLDNLTKRPKREIKFLLDVFAKNFPKLAREEFVRKYKVRVNAIGRWRELLPQRVVKAVEEPINATKSYNKFFLTFLMAYNGDDELTEAIREITKAAKRKKIKITWQTIKKFLWTKDLPPVDLLIRTSGEPHLSANFLSWHIGCSQLVFPKVYFPDFTEKEFMKALKEYLRRQRRFGG